VEKTDEFGENIIKKAAYISDDLLTKEQNKGFSIIHQNE
jgi:hypothetical protein